MGQFNEVTPEGKADASVHGKLTAGGKTAGQ